MFRKATEKDIDNIEKLYDEIHSVEEDGRTTIGWIRGVYPTRKDAENAVSREDMFVYEENGEIIASAIINQLQPDIYADCPWKYPAPDDKIMVIHTLCVSPAFFGRGIGTAFIRFYEEYASRNGCTVLRLDTNKTNKAARSLYGKLGYIESGHALCLFNGLRGIDLYMLEKKTNT